MSVLRLSAVALVAAIAFSAGANAQPCDQYVSLQRLPDRFEEIASGELSGGGELFVYSDGACTCDNSPAVARKLRKAAPHSAHWSCREATDDERRSL